jgi:hypothetical protein
VNLDGIRSAISARNLRESYNRYLAFGAVALSEAAIQEVIDAINKVRAGEREVVFVVPLPKNEKTEILLQLLTDIRDEFVSNSEHGLNTYLSLNIRHGTLSGQLRSPLAAANLLTTREPDSTNYTPNIHWATRLVTADETLKAHVSNLLAKFSHDFDALVEVIRLEWIQVRRQDADKGLFDFRVLDIDYRAIAVALGQDTTFEEFVDLVIERFMRRLEDQLTVVRQRFATEAKADFDELLVALLTAVQSLAEYANMTELENAIKGARTDFGHTINRIIDWFQLPKEVSAKPFALSFALTIAQESVKRMYGYNQLRSSITINDDILLPNILLPRIVSLFGNVFDNIARHARTPGPPAVEVRTDSTGDAVRVIIENEIGPDVANEVTRDKIKRIQSDIRQGAYAKFLSREGGTGLHKVHKLLTRDLEAAGGLQFGFRNDQKFFVEVTLSKDLCAI